MTELEQLQKDIDQLRKDIDQLQDVVLALVWNKFIRLDKRGRLIPAEPFDLGAAYNGIAGR